MCSAVPIAAESQAIQVVSYRIPFLVDDAENGVFVSLFKEAAKRSGLKYTLDIYPAEQAINQFEGSTAMAIMPALFPSLITDAALTRQIFLMNLYGFVLSDDVVPRTVRELEGKRVGLVNGYPYPWSILFNNSIVVDYADSADINLQKLKRGRIDVFVVDENTAFHMVRKLGFNKAKYDLSGILHSQPVFIAFQPTRKGWELSSQLSRAIESMKEDGTYDSIVWKMD